MRCFWRFCTILCSQISCCTMAWSAFTWVFIGKNMTLYLNAKMYNFISIKCYYELNFSLCLTLHDLWPLHMLCSCTCNFTQCTGDPSLHWFQLEFIIVLLNQYRNKSLSKITLYMTLDPACDLWLDFNTNFLIVVLWPIFGCNLCNGCKACAYKVSKFPPI